MPVTAISTSSSRGPIEAYSALLDISGAYLEPSDPHGLLYNYNMTFENKVALLKKWRDERTRFLLEYCRDMDYMNDGTMHAILHTLHAVRKEPRRHQ